MKGYTAKKGNQYYAVIYEGLDPFTGKEKRAWHPVGPNKPEAERLAKHLAAEAEGSDDKARSLPSLRSAALARRSPPSDPPGLLDPLKIWAIRMEGFIASNKRDLRTIDSFFILEQASFELDDAIAGLSELVPTDIRGNCIQAGFRADGQTW